MTGRIPYYLPEDEQSYLTYVTQDREEVYADSRVVRQ